MDHTVTVWDLAAGTGKELRGHKDEIRHVAFSKDGNVLASGSRDNTAILWDTATWSEIESLKSHSHNVECLAFWTDKETTKLLTGSSDYTVKCWEIGKRGPTRLALEGGVEHIALSPDTKILAAMQGTSEHVTIWHLGGVGTQRMPLEVGELASSIAVSERFLAVGVRGGVRRWRLDGFVEEEPPFRSENATTITALEFSQDGKLLAAGCGKDCLTLWDTTDPKPRFEHVDLSGPVTCVSFTPKGDILASASDNGTITLWETETGELVNTVTASEEAVVSVSFCPRSGLMASGAYDSMVRLWQNWRVAGDKADARLIGHSDGIRSICFPPDGHTLITASGDTSLKVWDIRERQERLSMEEHSSSVRCAVLSSDGTLLVSGGRNGTIHLWRAATKEEVAETER